MKDIVLVRNISFGVFLGALLFFLLGFGAPQWAEYTDEDGLFYHEGLWKRCWDAGFGKSCNSMDPDWTVSKVKATQANMCLTLIMAGASMVAYICWLAQKTSDIRSHGMTDVGRIALYCEATAGCFNFLAILIYGFYWLHLGSFLHWGYALSVVSSLIFLAHGFGAICLADCSPAPQRSHPHDASYPAVSAVPQTHLAGAYPSVQPVGGVYPPTQPVYFMSPNAGNGQPMSVMYQPQGGATHMGAMAPPYTPEEAQDPPQYQPEWGNKQTLQDAATAQPVHLSTQPGGDSSSTVSNPNSQPEPAHSDHTTAVDNLAYDSVE